MANLSLVLAALRSNVKAALQASGLPYGGEVFLEFPVPGQIAKAVSSNSQGAFVSIWPLDGAVNQTRYPVQQIPPSSLTPGMTASIDETGEILTIGGGPVAGDVVHAFFGVPLLDAAYRVGAGDSAAAIAVAVAAAANAYSAPGITATPSGDTVMLSGATWVKVNVGASGVAQREIMRVERLVDVTVWAATSAARLAIGDAILASGIGSANNPTLLCSDGTRANVSFGTDKLGLESGDAAQESYSISKRHIIYRIEYGITQAVDVTQVEGVEWTQQLGSLTRTFYAGGTP